MTVAFERKKNNLIREFKSKLKNKVRYEDLLIEKIDWLLSLELSIVPVSSRDAIIQNKISFGGKIVWDKDAEPKKPLSLFVNVVDFEDTEFMTILLHEFGHIADKDNDKIELETPTSEISAWKHAIEDFNTLEPDKSEKLIFIDVMKRGLKSYKVDNEDIEKLVFALC
ncbi:hypothetical protein [Cyclobacterium sp.]|uniref:hypothetical protein n=1 Tax=Cyclobacterium sp. TaxID=1966343 RepID=UPI0019A2A1FE|nr:hypothetical protein [Cyclobacterium sp.]MBD3628286.1 hypothetical protein [Cyclobacterium sp.]